MAIIECEKLIKKYMTGEETFYALNEVSFSIEKGSYVSICGQSGCGKSTLLNMIGLIDCPDDGDVIIDGVSTKSLKENKLADIREKQLGYIFQSFFLEPKYSAYRNVEIPLLIGGCPKKEREEKVREALEKVSMLHRMKTKAADLSGGEKQRICIARAMVNRPQILLADEPCGNLDSTNKANILELFAKLHEEEKCTIVMVTHSEKDTEYSDYVIRMKDGKVVG